MTGYISFLELICDTEKEVCLWRRAKSNSQNAMNAVYLSGKIRMPDQNDSARTGVVTNGGTNTVMNLSMNAKSQRTAYVAERSFMRMKDRKGNTARRIVSTKPEDLRLRRKGRNLTRGQHLAEQNYRICLRIVSVLHANGLLKGKELVSARKILKRKYNPVIGELDDEGDNKE